MAPTSSAPSPLFYYPNQKELWENRFVAETHVNKFLELFLNQMIGSPISHNVHINVCIVVCDDWTYRGWDHFLENKLFAVMVAFTCTYKQKSRMGFLEPCFPWGPPWEGGWVHKTPFFFYAGVKRWEVKLLYFSCSSSHATSREMYTEGAYWVHFSKKKSMLLWQLGIIEIIILAPCSEDIYS